MSARPVQRLLATLALVLTPGCFAPGLNLLAAAADRSAKPDPWNFPGKVTTKMGTVLAGQGTEPAKHPLVRSLDASGDVRWEYGFRPFGTAKEGQPHDTFHRIVELEDGRLALLAGDLRSTRFAVVFMNRAGLVLSATELSLPAPTDDRPGGERDGPELFTAGTGAVVMVPVVVANQRRMWFALVGVDGKLEWSRILDGWSRVLTATWHPSLGLVVAGRVPGAGLGIVRLDATGTVVWTTALGVAPEWWGARLSLREDGILVTVAVPPEQWNPAFNLGLVLLNADGTVRWQRLLQRPMKTVAKSREEAKVRRERVGAAPMVQVGHLRADGSSLVAFTVPTEPDQSFVVLSEVDPKGELRSQRGLEWSVQDLYWIDEDGPWLTLTGRSYSDRERWLFVNGKSAQGDELGEQALVSAPATWGQRAFGVGSEPAPVAASPLELAPQQRD